MPIWKIKSTINTPTPPPKCPIPLISLGISTAFRGQGDGYFLELVLVELVHTIFTFVLLYCYKINNSI